VDRWLAEVAEAEHQLRRPRLIAPPVPTHRIEPDRSQPYGVGDRPLVGIAGQPGDGVTLFTTHVRRAAPDTLDPKLNAHSKLNDIPACIQAYTAGADEALMLDPHGFVATCNSTHFFVVVGPDDAPEVLTSDGRYCLAGITRANVLHICRANGIPAREATFSLTDVYAAREAFVTGTFAGVVPVRSVDARTIGDGHRGPMVKRLQALYGELVHADVAARASP
jgi:branched-chain amino acid aminotransferase